jgi:hypothetical protein
MGEAERRATVLKPDEVDKGKEEEEEEEEEEVVVVVEKGAKTHQVFKAGKVSKARLGVEQRLSEFVCRQLIVRLPEHGGIGARQLFHRHSGLLACVGHGDVAGGLSPAVARLLASSRRGH